MDSVSTTHTLKGGKLLRIVCAIALALTMMPAMAFTGVNKAFAGTDTAMSIPTKGMVIYGPDVYTTYGGEAELEIQTACDPTYEAQTMGFKILTANNAMDMVISSGRNAFPWVEVGDITHFTNRDFWDIEGVTSDKQTIGLKFENVTGTDTVQFAFEDHWDHGYDDGTYAMVDMVLAGGATRADVMKKANIIMQQPDGSSSLPTVYLVHNVNLASTTSGSTNGGTLDFGYDKDLTIESSGAVTKGTGNGDVAVAADDTGSATMAQKDAATVTAAANTGFTIKSLTVDGTAVAAAVGKTSYTFTYNGLATVSSAADAGSIAVEYEPASTPSYIVNHYVQNTDGSYPTTPTYTETKSAAVNAAVSATPITTGTKNGVDFDGVTKVTNASEVLSGNVAADGSTVLKVYYDRNTVTLTFVANDSTASITGTDTRTGLYGAPFTTPTVTNTDSLKIFQGWFDAASGGTAYTGTTLPAANKIVYAQWDSKATVTATAGANGTITPSGSAQYNLGATPAYTMTPNAGYCVDTVTVSDQTRYGATSKVYDADVEDLYNSATDKYVYTFAALAASGSIDVTFAKDTNHNFIPDYKEIVFTYTIPSEGFTTPTTYKEIQRMVAAGNSPTWKANTSAVADVPDNPAVKPGWIWTGWDDGGQTNSAANFKTSTYTASTTFTAKAKFRDWDAEVNFRVRDNDFGAISGTTQLECYKGQALGSLSFPDVRSTDIPAGQWTKDMRTVSQFIGWYDVNANKFVAGTEFPVVPTTTKIEQFTTTNNANIATAKEALKNYVATNETNSLEARFQKVDINLVPHDLTITRLFGDDRIGTAKAIADNALVTNATPENAIIVATAANFPDALTGASLAGAYNADIVLTDTDTLSAACKQALTSSSASKVFILGGTGAVSASVERQIRTIKPDTTRLGGADRMATAELIADCVSDSIKAPATMSDTCVIAAAANFPDALSASAYAAYTKSPIFLTAFDGKSISATTLGKIKDGGYKNVIVVGGEMAVDAKVINQVKGAGISSVTRLGGADRYDTSARIADFEMNAGIGMSYDRCGIATGEKFPDALCGGAMQGRDGSVILLTATDSLSDSCASVLNANKNIITEIRFFGGTSAVSKNTVKAAVDCINHTPTLTWKPAGTQLF